MKEKIPNKHKKNHYLRTLFSNNLFEKKKKEKNKQRERERTYIQSQGSEWLGNVLRATSSLHDSR